MSKFVVIAADDEPFQPKRGRPNAHQAAAIERTIREAAAQVFLSEGYERASMEMIAAQAGVPKSTLYKRFPEKRALLRAVLGGQVAAWCEIDRSHTAADDLEQRLKHLATDMLRHATKPQVQTFWTLVSTAWSGPDEAEQRHEAIGYSKMIAGLEREICELGPGSGISARNPRRVATVLMTMLCGWIEHVAPTADRPEEEARRFAHAAVDMLIRGAAAW
ncbi:TetR/AcrR family transcriptional regulator [Novosphingobium sp. PS1R-30]|uniref:TetR/AcrR family transcriptional regulator n=1 Tax=Novosphingobium anseongense TaxID=3133436 RepID=A0ABU8S2X0_9SPHN